MFLPGVECTSTGGSKGGTYPFPGGRPRIRYLLQRQNCVSTGRLDLGLYTVTVWHAYRTYFSIMISSMNYTSLILMEIYTKYNLQKLLKPTCRNGTMMTNTFSFIISIFCRQSWSNIYWYILFDIKIHSILCDKMCVITFQNYIH